MTAAPLAGAGLHSMRRAEPSYWIDGVPGVPGAPNTFRLAVLHGEAPPPSTRARTRTV